MSKRSLPAILKGRASNTVEYVIAVRSSGPSWPLRQTPGGEWLCRCEQFWKTGDCVDVTAARQWEARQAKRVSQLPAEPAEPPGVPSDA